MCAVGNFQTDMSAFGADVVEEVAAPDVLGRLHDVGIDGAAVAVQDFEGLLVALHEAVVDEDGVVLIVAGPAMVEEFADAGVQGDAVGAELAQFVLALRLLQGSEAELVVHGLDLVVGDESLHARTPPRVPDPRV